MQSLGKTHEIALNIDVWTLKTRLLLEMISISAFLSRYLAERTNLGVSLFPTVSLYSDLDKLSVMSPSELDVFEW